MVNIYTTQISVARKLRLIADPRYLDITVKSGDKAFAPTWKMVMNYKAGTMSEVEYTSKYYAMMQQSYIQNRERWDKILSMEEVILACYCHAGSFCHRYLLKDVLTGHGAKYVCEIKSLDDEIYLFEELCKNPLLPLPSVYLLL